MTQTVTLVGADKLKQPLMMKLCKELWDNDHKTIDGLFSRIDKIEIDTFGHVMTWVPAMICAGQQMFRRTIGPS